MEAAAAAAAPSTRLWLSVFILVVAVAASFVGLRETFAAGGDPAPPQPPSRPCAVYYTENTATCDAGHYAKSSREHVVRLQSLTRSGQGKSAEAGHIRNVLNDRVADRLPNPRICKIPIDSYMEVADAPRKFGFAGSPSQLRGPPQHWAFCFRPAANESEAQGHIAAFGTRDGVRSDPDLIRDFSDNRVYSRIHFDALDYSSMTRTHCSTGTRPAESLPALIRFKLDPTTLQINDITAVTRNVNYELAPADNLFPETFGRLFAKTIFRNRIYDVPVPRNVQIYRFSKDVCGRNNLDRKIAMRLNLVSMGIAPLKIDDSPQVADGSPAVVLRKRSELAAQLEQLISQKAAATADIATVPSRKVPGLYRELYKLRLSSAPNLSSTVALNELFNMPGRMTPAHRGVDTTIHYRTHTGVPGIAEYFAGTWTGFLNISAADAGDYQFNINSDDAADFYINGRLVAHYYGYHWYSNGGQPVSATQWVNLPAGEHRVNVRLVQWAGDRGLELYWKKRNRDSLFQLIPASAFTTTDPEAETRLRASIRETEVAIEQTTRTKAGYDQVVEKLQRAPDVEHFRQAMMGKYLDGWVGAEHISDDDALYLELGSEPVEDNSLDDQVLQEEVLQAPRILEDIRIDYNKSPQYTLAFWMNIPGPGTDWRCVFYHGRSDDWTNWTRDPKSRGVDRTPGIWVYPDRSTRIHFRHRRVGDWTFNEGLDVVNNPVGFNTWFHYTVVVDQNRARVYINGRQNQSATYPTNFEWNYDAARPKKVYLNRWIHNNYNSSIRIQKMYWYNRVLDDSEIATLAAEPVANHLGVPVPQVERFVGGDDAAAASAAVPPVPAAVAAIASGKIPTGTPAAAAAPPAGSATPPAGSAASVGSAAPSAASVGSAAPSAASVGSATPSAASIEGFAVPATTVRGLFARIPASSGIYQLMLNNRSYNVYVQIYKNKPWLLILNYLHRAGTNPALFPRSDRDGFPLLNAESFGIDGSADRTSWGHLIPAFLNMLDFDQLRFYARSSNGKTIHFTTDESASIQYFRTGRGSAVGGRAIAWTAENGHNATIPGNAPNRFENQGNYAMTEFPFWRWGQAHWSIRGYGTHWEVDTGWASGTRNHTHHQIWVGFR